MKTLPATMNIQSNVEVSQAYNASKTPAAASRNQSTPATKAMMVRLETTKTGLWISRPRGRMLWRPSSESVFRAMAIRNR